MRKKKDFTPLSSELTDITTGSLDPIPAAIPESPAQKLDDDEGKNDWTAAVLYEFAADDPKRKRAEKALATLAAHQYRKRDAVEQRMTLTLRDVSHMLQISERTVRRYVADGKLRAVKIGREYRITLEEYDAFTMR
jgi:excisionase family DNA binding protein